MHPYDEVENSHLFMGIENFAHLVDFIKVITDFFELPDTLRLGESYLNGHLVVRLPSPATEPTLYSTGGDGVARGNTCGELQPVEAVAAFNFRGLDLKILLFARHEICATPGVDVDEADAGAPDLLLVGEEERHLMTEVEKNVNEVEAELEKADESGEVIMEADGSLTGYLDLEDGRHSVPEDDAAGSPVPHADPAGGAATSGATFDTRARVFRNRWAFKGKGGIRVIARLMNGRAPRWLLSGPTIRVDMFPSLTLGGNTSTAIELVWRELKQTLTVPQPLHVLIVPLALRFIHWELHFVDGCTTVLLALREEPRGRVQELEAAAEAKERAKLLKEQQKISDKL